MPGFLLVEGLTPLVSQKKVGELVSQAVCIYECDSDSCKRITRY